MEHLPLYVSTLFVLTTSLAVFFLYKATRYSKTTLLLVIAWLIITTVISLTGFLTITHTMPPRFAVLVIPPVALISFLFISPKGRRFLNNLDLNTLTLLHVVRVPVELVLFFLAMHGAVPDLMTFEGRNFDILSGLTAPLVYYLGFVKNRISRKVILLWNFVCLALLFNIVTTAILAAPTPFQQLAFSQPNRAVLHFPFVWLPAIIVPMVLFAHLVTIRQLLSFKPKVNAVAESGLAIKF